MQWHAVFLWLLLTAFCYRVAAQVMIALDPTFATVFGLPPFEDWHSGLLPYPVLVAAQFLIIAFLFWIAWGVAMSKPPMPKFGRFLDIFGWIYFIGMLGRLILGMTWLQRDDWFNKPLPTIFHLVLAGFCVIAAEYHLQSIDDDDGYEE